MSADLLTELSEVLRQQQDTIAHQDRLINILLEKLKETLSEQELKEVKLYGGSSNTKRS